MWGGRRKCSEKGGKQVSPQVVLYEFIFETRGRIIALRLLLDFVRGSIFMRYTFYTCQSIHPPTRSC